MVAFQRKRAAALAMLGLMAINAHAQLSNVPSLQTGSTTSNGENTDTSTGASTPTQKSTPSTTTPGQTQTKTTPTSGATSQTTSSASSITTGSDTITGAPTINTGTTSVFHLSGVPSIAGAGIPQLVIPYTADAPFMQKSHLPEGTVFIAVGAVLAFLGACVLLWRGLVAWSINHSVKKAALASLRAGGGSEKDMTARHWRTSAYQPISSSKSGLYKDEYGSSMSLEALTSSGKPIKSHFRESVVERSSTPPQNLFFSPTAHAQPSYRDSVTPAQRASAHMPAGYYASPSAQPAGGAYATTMGAGHNSISPYARQSQVSLSYPVGNPASPPSSPGLPPTTTRPNTTRRNTSREGTRRVSYRDSSRHSHYDVRHGAGPAPNTLYSQPSYSSLLVGGGASSEALSGSRAPSAYLDDLFENHGNGPRERF